MAIIFEKDTLGKPKIIKSIIFPPTKEEEEVAIKFDNLLIKSIPKIEEEFIKGGLLSSKKSIKKNQGNIELWFSLGKKLREIIFDSGLVKKNEYIWALQVIRKYLSLELLRKDRGSRLHLDYCIRVSNLPWDSIKKMNWGDWVYFLDSKSLRNELRADDWIKENINELSKLNRTQFRELAKKINKALKDIDTSIYTEKELFEVYNNAFCDVKVPI